MAVEKGRSLCEQANSYSQKSVGLDPGFGSSAFDVCFTELVDGMINVLHAEEYPRPDFNQMISTTVRLLEEYDITFEGRSRIFVDGANPSFIRALKELITALRTAVEKGDGILDKEATSHDDLLDAFRLALQFWH